MAWTAFEGYVFRKLSIFLLRRKNKVVVIIYVKIVKFKQDSYNQGFYLFIEHILNSFEWDSQSYIVGPLMFVP